MKGVSNNIVQRTALRAAADARAIYGNTAALVSRYRQTACLDGRDLSHRMDVTDIRVRGDARWQIVRRHAPVTSD